MDTKRVALLYDPIVLEHRPSYGHPERPERAATVVKTIEKQGDLWDRLIHLPVRPGAREELLRVHSAAMVDKVERVCAQGGGLLDAGDTIASEGSWSAALIATGAAIGAVDAVLSPSGNSVRASHGEFREPTGSPATAAVGLDAAFAVVRPPGHHATPRQSMGFCLFNNIAVAAAHAIAAHGLTRILIVDFDVHHGNGTQDAFYDDPRVLFFSSHQYPAYPGTGAADQAGEGAGLGYTINFPMPPGVGDDDFARIMDTILRPAADRYRPELILVSAGYDAHWRNSAYVAGIDERVTIDGFYRISKQIQAIADAHCPGRLAAVLEGGYDLEALGAGVAATLRAWLGDPEVEDKIGQSPLGVNESAALDERLARVKAVHGL